MTCPEAGGLMLITSRAKIIGVLEAFSDVVENLYPDMEEKRKNIRITIESSSSW
jgi:hypothetical protein